MVGFKRESLTLESSSITFISRSRKRKSYFDSPKKAAVTFLLTLLAGLNSNPLLYHIERNGNELSISVLANQDEDPGSIDSVGLPHTYSHRDGSIRLRESRDVDRISATEREIEMESGGGESKGFQWLSLRTTLDHYLERGGKESHVGRATSSNVISSNIVIKDVRDAAAQKGSRSQRVRGAEGGAVGSTIQNRMVHYGVYCGPGPADAFSGITPIHCTDRCIDTRTDRQIHCADKCTED